MIDQRPGPGRFFPWPLVGVAALLVTLILLTPDLQLTGSPSAGTFLTQAELIVDWDPGHNLTHFYVRGLGTVRYSSIIVGIATNYNWSSPSAIANLTWKWTNGTAVISVNAETKANPAVINVSSLYTDAFGSTVEFVGLYAFSAQSGTLTTRSLLSGEPGALPRPYASLPLTLLLETVAVGTVP